MYSYEHLSTVYVSQKIGDDKANGLAPYPDGNGNAPLFSLERALELVGELRGSGVERPLTVSLVDDYYLTAPIHIKEKLLTVESFGAQKRIIGGIRIDGWERGERGGVSCLFAKLPEKEGGYDFTDLYVNGERALVTRYPKEGRLRIADADNNVASLPKFDHFSCASKWIQAFPEDLAHLGDLTDAIVNYFHYWIDEHSPIESYDRESGKMIMKYHSRFGVCNVYDGKNPAAIHYYLTNVGATFGSKREWFLDRRSSTVYYIPESDAVAPESIEAFAPTQDKLFYIEGEDIRLRNLELTCTSGDYASTARYGCQNEKALKESATFASDIQSVCCAPGAIVFEKASRCGIFDCCIHGVGIHAIEIKKSCDHIRIESNHIYDLCAGGIKLEGGSAPEDAALTASDCIIAKNHIHACGKRYMAGCGILIMHARDCEISENEIHDTEYSGISVGWVWGYAESSTYGCAIRGNHIYDIGKGNLSDMGGIYLLGRHQGTVVAENRIHDVRCLTYGAWGIYLDEGSSFVTVERNAVYNTGSESFHLHYGSHNTVKNNIFYAENAPCVAISKSEEHYQAEFEQNLLITKGQPIFKTRYPEMPLRFGRNLIWDTTRPVPRTRIDKLGNISDIQTLFENGNIVADPKLSGLDNLDFTLAPDSPAFALGFSPLADSVAKNNILYGKL